MDVKERYGVLDAHGYVELVGAWGSDEAIVAAARMSTSGSFRGWGTPSDPGDEKLLRYLAKHRHDSPFEMAGLTVEICAPIFVAREWMRHRTQSYNEQSARYTVLLPRDYVPSMHRMQSGGQSHTNKQSSGEPLDELACEEWLLELQDLFAHCDRVYQSAVHRGVSRELARLAVPVARYTRFRASANLRNWLSFVSLRTDAAAQLEIRAYANVVCDLIAEKFPRSFEAFTRAGR